MKWSNEDAKWKVKMDNRKNSQIQPGFCIVQNPGTLASQAQEIFQGRNHDAAKLFMQLNGNTQWVKPSQMLIIADPNNNNQNHQISKMQEAKRKVDSSLATADLSTAGFLNEHYGTIAALTNFMDKSTGIVSDAAEKHFSQIEKTLKQIELTYQNQFRSQGSLIGQQFFSERARLFNQLNLSLDKLSKLVLKIKPYNDIKRALNLSSRSIVHEWQSAGVGAIKGYSTYIDRAAATAKYVKAGGWVSIGFAAMNTTNEVHHACTTGRESECKKVAVREYSKFGASTVASIYGGGLGGLGATALCVAVGVPTGGLGTLACGIIGGTVAGAASGAVAEKSTDYFMDWIL